MDNIDTDGKWWNSKIQVEHLEDAQKKRSFNLKKNSFLLFEKSINNVVLIAQAWANFTRAIKKKIAARNSLLYVLIKPRLHQNWTPVPSILSSCGYSSNFIMWEYFPNKIQRSAPGKA